MPDEYYYKTILDFYNRVRSVLKNIPEMVLPYEQTDYFENAPLAETVIKNQVLNWQILIEDETKKSIFDSAIVIQTALNSFNTATANGIKIQQTESMKIEFFESDPLLLRADLSAKLRALLDALAENEYSYKPAFRTSGGRIPRWGI